MLLSNDVCNFGFIHCRTLVTNQKLLQIAIAFDNWPGRHSKSMSDGIGWKSVSQGHKCALAWYRFQRSHLILELTCSPIVNLFSKALPTAQCKTLGEWEDEGSTANCNLH